jgi:starvation-inducible DNA-binding protein
MLELKREYIMKSLNVALNHLVADLNVEFVKLHHHHWFVKGLTFFQFHEKFQEMYEEINSLYDEVAERLITLGGTPASSLQAYVTLSKIKEATPFQSINETLLIIKKDYEHLVSAFKDALKLAQAEGDEATADLCITAIGKFEKSLWMIQASLS